LNYLRHELFAYGFLLYFYAMLTNDEIMFIRYWERRREKEKKLSWQLLTGIPRGAMFALPVIIILISARFWYKRADMTANAQLNPIILSIGVFSIIFFVAVFYKRYKWEENEQRYLEFKAKATKEDLERIKNFDEQAFLSSRKR